MNIEKIKNYNTTMLAVIVTAAVAFAVIGLFAFLFFLLTEVFNYFPRNYSTGDSGIPANQEILTQEEDREKLYIAFSFPELIDTTNQLYIIPVSHLRSDQLLQEYSRKITFSSDKTYGSYDGYSDYDYNYNKQFINLVVYDAKSGVSEILFKQKVLLGQFTPRYFKDEIWVMFEAAFADTDKDGRITFEDQSSLFIYSMKTKILKQVKFEDKSLLQFSFIGDTKDLIVRFGNDYSKRYNNLQGVDSVAICRYTYDTDQLVKINDNKLQKSLQDIINKTK